MSNIKDYEDFLRFAISGVTLPSDLNKAVTRITEKARLEGNIISNEEELSKALAVAKIYVLWQSDADVLNARELARKILSYKDEPFYQEILSEANKSLDFTFSTTMEPFDFSPVFRLAKEKLMYSANHASSHTKFAGAYMDWPDTINSVMDELSSSVQKTVQSGVTRTAVIERKVELEEALEDFVRDDHWYDADADENELKARAQEFSEQLKLVLSALDTLKKVSQQISPGDSIQTKDTDKRMVLLKLSYDFDKRAPAFHCLTNAADVLVEIVDTKAESTVVTNAKSLSLGSWKKTQL